MKTRNISVEEMSKFMILKNGNDASERLKSMIDSGRTKLEWCFVIEEKNKFTGKMIYGVFQGDKDNLKILRMEIDGEGQEQIDRRTNLLEESIQALKSGSPESIEYHLYSDGTDDFNTFKEIFENVGFLIEQEKSSYTARSVIEDKMNKRLQFKTLEELEGDEFIKMIMWVTEDTLDRDDQRCIKEDGEEGAAKNYFSILKDIDYNPKWWKAAYDNAGDFVGIVVPQRFNDKEGAINYVGVTPNQRGKGYVQELIYHGTNLLLDNGIECVIADIDKENFPMEKALERLGYEFDSEMVVLKYRF